MLWHATAFPGDPGHFLSFFCGSSCVRHNKNSIINKTDVEEIKWANAAIKVARCYGRNGLGMTGDSTSPHNDGDKLLFRYFFKFLVFSLFILGERTVHGTYILL